MNAMTEHAALAGESQIQLALLAAMQDIARTGIAKTSKAALGGSTVAYRGIEAAMNEMSVVLTRHNITVTPRYSELQVSERAKAEGKATRFVTIKGAFTFSAPDQSSVVCECYGEAMDSGDKAVTKAQSVAFRTALFQQFVIPTMAMDPEDDPESAAHEEPEAPQSYDQTAFDANLGQWRVVIKSGRKTADNLIAFIESRGKPLTEAQKQALRSTKID